MKNKEIIKLIQAKSREIAEERHFEREKWKNLFESARIKTRSKKLTASCVR
jgi:hypothetical protein